jgi:hypothetical protein
VIAWYANLAISNASAGLWSRRRFALLGALDAGDDHAEVRWTVLHVIESQDAAPYLIVTMEALARNPGSEWAVGRTARPRTGAVGCHG